MRKIDATQKITLDTTFHTFSLDWAAPKKNTTFGLDKKNTAVSADIRALSFRLVYRLIENKGGGKGATLMKSYRGRLRRGKRRKGEEKCMDLR